MEIDRPGVDLPSTPAAPSTVPSSSPVSSITIWKRPTAGAADVDRAMRRLVTCMMQQRTATPELAGGLQRPFDGLRRPRPVGRDLLVGERLLPRGAQQVGHQDVRVRRVDHRGLRRLVEQVLGVRHQVLVEGLVLRHEHRERALRTRAPPARPAATWRPASPGTRPAARRPASRCRSRARGRSSRPRRSARRSPAAAPARAGPRPGSRPGRPSRVNAARRPDRAVRTRPAAPPPAGTSRTRSTSPLLGQTGHQERGLGERAPPGARLLVHDRRVPQREHPAAARRAVLGHRVEGLADQPLGELGRVARRSPRRGRTPGPLRSARRAAGGGRSTCATCDPNTPRNTCASSTTTTDRRRKKSAQRGWSGRIPACSMSGLVITRFAFLRISGRSVAACRRRTRRPAAAAA